MPRRVDQDFFKQPADLLAPALLGAVLVRTVDGTTRRARIVETEAYLGPSDLASHSSKGLTKRTKIMFGPPGRAYVYFIYGMHEMFNIVCGIEGEAHAVLLRGAEPLDGWEADLTGPGRLARAFGITRADNGTELLGEAFRFEFDPLYAPRTLRTPRIGVDYARHWSRRLLRFIDASNPIAAKLRGVTKRREWKKAKTADAR